MDELTKSRLKWQCRRGMLELDFILGNFFDDYFDILSAQQQTYFAELLGQVDSNLYAWLLGHEQPEEPHLKELVDYIRSHELSANKT